jgi:4-carboxymuconolactone decarboxylase
VTGSLYPSAIRYGYGEIWNRPGLTYPRRALVAIAGFTALRLPEQVAKFGQSALNLGLTQTEVIEAIIQTAPYTGFPPALNALGAISAVFRPPA